MAEISPVMKIFYRTWFALTFLPILTAVWLCCQISMYMPGLGSTVQRQRFAIFCVRYGMRLYFVLSPWIRVKPPSKKEWEALRKLNHRTLVCLNHTSQLDSLVFIAYCPVDLLMHMRTLLKAALFKYPLFGALCKAAGHFPVYFSKGDHGSFSVDKEKMARVMEDVQRHVQSGEALTMYPEGQLNRNPSVLQSFRHGSFNIALQHKLPIFSFIQSHVEDSWPLKDPVGGLPANIELHMTPILLDYNNTEKPINNNVELSQYVQEKMQAIVDSVYKDKKTQ